mmetsp:Transcript_20582/g.32185  ORF Transcript_20582/g.32185 Transcript_20582/m.32185 type:complete len:96 (-) Transcript_20582:894-1181(-)
MPKEEMFKASFARREALVDTEGDVMEVQAGTAGDQGDTAVEDEGRVGWYVNEVLMTRELQAGERMEAQGNLLAYLVLVPSWLSHVNSCVLKLNAP